MAARLIIAVVVLFHALFATVRSANLFTHSSVKRTKARKSRDFLNTFDAPTMLLISSPMERKVSYTMVKDFKSVGGVVLPILDAGLISPYGIAWDGPRSALYICDGALRKIFRVNLKAFKCLRQCKGLEYHLRTEGNRYTVAEGVIAQWASVDNDGNLFFTDQETNSVNKLPVEVIDKITKEQMLPKDLRKTSEPEAEGEEAIKEKMGTSTIAHPPSIYQLYEKDVSPNVGTPAGVIADGTELYWTNQVGGFSSGAVAEGKTSPRVKKISESEDKPTFPSVKITNNTASAYGITLTSSKIVYTDTAHNVWSCSRGTGETVALTRGLLKPRGIVWDGDNTVFVADQEGNSIVSMPVGLLKAGAPVTHTLDIHAPFGMGMVSSKDPIWDDLASDSQRSRAYRFVNTHCLVMVMVTAALSVALGLPNMHS